MANSMLSTHKVTLLTETFHALGIFFTQNNINPLGILQNMSVLMLEVRLVHEEQMNGANLHF